MWMLKSSSTVATAALAPPCSYAASIFAFPPVESGTHMSRGIDSMTTCLVVGLTLARIIDCVSTGPPMNLASLSEPSSSTVKGAPGGGGTDCAVAVAAGDEPGDAIAEAD